MRSALLSRACVFLALVTTECAEREQPQPQEASAPSNPAPSAAANAGPQNLVLSDMLSRTFFIRVKGQPEAGTAFIADAKGRQYLITAAHVVSGSTGSFPIEIVRRGAWAPATATLVGTAQPRADVAVITLDRLLMLPTTPPAILSDVDVPVSGTVFFLGFPFGLGTIAGEANSGYPIPLVKGAIVSGFIRSEKGTAGFFLDAMNNEGFSGGPVLTAGSPPKIVAVIASYLQSPREAVDSTGKPSGLRVQENTGIVQSYGIHYATELIEANPIGFPNNVL